MCTFYTKSIQIGTLALRTHISVENTSFDAIFFLNESIDVPLSKFVPIVKIGLQLKFPERFEIPVDFVILYRKVAVSDVL